MPSQPIDLAATHRLGGRAFLLFLFRHIGWPVFFLVVLGSARAFEDRVPGAYFLYADYAIKIALLIAAAFFAFRSIKAYLEYRSYAYRFDEEFFHLSRGYFKRQEIGVVYHQIQTVTIRRGVNDRLMGVSHLIIVMNGNQHQPAEVLLPALEYEKAKLVQRELLRKARMHASRGSAAPATPPDEDPE